MSIRLDVLILSESSGGYRAKYGCRDSEHPDRGGG